MAGQDKAVKAGSVYRERIARYINKHYQRFGLKVYEEHPMGRTGDGRGRRNDVFVYREEDERVHAFECKYQSVRGSAEDKIGWTVHEEIRKNTRGVDTTLVCGGPGWSPHKRGWMAQQPDVLFCEPNSKMTQTSKTRALDEAIVQVFDLPLKDTILKGCTPLLRIVPKRAVTGTDDDNT